MAYAHGQLTLMDHVQTPPVVLQGFLSAIRVMGSLERTVQRKLEAATLLSCTPRDSSILFLLAVTMQKSFMKTATKMKMSTRGNEERASRGA